MRIAIISQQHFHNQHVSLDTTVAFESAIMKVSKGESSVQCELFPVSEFCYKINRKLTGDIKKLLPEFMDYGLVRKIKRFQPDYLFIMAMGSDTIRHEMKTLKKLNIPLIVYCVDTWESRLQTWKDMLKQLNIGGILCCYKNSVEKFKEVSPHVQWLPYSMNPKYFHPRPIQERTHLFMQMGRKNMTLHEYVLRYIEEHGLSDSDYIREAKLGQIIYPEFEQLASEICATRFFVLSPRDVDDFEITGAISDVTARFYEGMACKALLVGYKPKDTFDTLFPSETAMITVDSYEDFESKIDYYLSHEDEYNRIVEDNYEYLMEHHTWQHRAKELFQYIDSIT